MLDFDRYFLKESQVFLSHIDYDFLSFPQQVDNKLSIKDTIGVYNLEDGKVKIEITRSLDFGAGKLFSLTVVFGILLRKNPFSENEIDWANINLAEEIKNANLPLVKNVMSKMCVLIAEITSSYGQVPVITPPQLIK